MKKIFWLAGENSGDLHASYVIKQLNSRAEIQHFGVGGPKMQNEGLKTCFDFKRFNVMGFIEVVKHLFFFIKIEKKIKNILVTEKPDLVVLVDYPGLNLRIAKIAKKLGIRVLYYICPQFWAWKHKRVFKIKKYTDFVCCINPFESPLLDNFEIPNYFVGHPVAEEISATMRKEEFARRFKIDLKKEWIALFPGSRMMELKRHIPLFKVVASQDPEREYLISLADDSFQDYFDKTYFSPNVTIIKEHNYDMMKHCDFVVAKSGTTTLETTLFATPFVIVYKANPITVMIAKMISRVKYIGLPNLIADKMVVKELIQRDASADNIVAELEANLNDRELKTQYTKNLLEIKALLGDRSASKNTADKILEMMSCE